MLDILKKINSPFDLKKLSLSELQQLAQEIRNYLLEVVASNGGHLAPNLGVVELTLAIHSVYSSPIDKIVWDVGHQAYVHKLLTGRFEEFKTLRQYQGISGFPKRSESPHDSFGTGHSSTSISAALGFAQARDLKGEKHEVVAVIGDGAMTGGMAFEALNHAGHLNTKLTVILNDNEMSIAQNVGAMSAYLNRVRTDPLYTKRKEDIEYLLKKIPAIGSKVVKVADRVKDSLKYLLVPGILFEELGFKYFGPVNGHDINELRKVLQNTKHINKPVLVHVITKKGKGYPPAEKNPDRFHGIGIFDLKTGELCKKTDVPTYTKVFSDTLVKLGEMDPKVLAFTAAMGEGAGTSDFSKRFPKRSFDVGIAEQHAVTMAAALALEGFKPVVAIYSTFLQRAYDQIVHDVCLQNAPVVFALDRAGLVGEDGPTHHGVFDLSYLRHIPNLTIMAPKDENELQHMLYTGILHNGPVAIRYPRGCGLGVPLDADFRPLPIGRAEVLQKGRDLTLIAVGSMVDCAVKVSRLLTQKGVACTVINARFIKPLDAETILEAVNNTNGVVTLEENVLNGGFGSAILELMAEEGLEQKVLRIGLEDSFSTHGNINTLREIYGLTPEKVLQRIEEEFSFKAVNKLNKLAINLIRRNR
ncbi:MAG: 1-deoxy-D-xylulose-5-phosphate synthase [Clostridia bacterium]|nr:1-deoxy-D-xylulose-5-phosphate synthase [Clostridia bacterium]